MSLLELGLELRGCFGDGNRMRIASLSELAIAEPELVVAELRAAIDVLLPFGEEYFDFFFLGFFDRGDLTSLDG